MPIISNFPTGDAVPVLGWSGVQLLDNSYWVTRNAIINQRGKTEYVGVRGTIDRWMLEAGLKVTVLEKGIKIDSVSATSLKDFFQVTEDTFLGETLTFSILTSEGELIQATGTVPASGNSFVTVANTITDFGRVTLYADMAGNVYGSSGRLQASIRVSGGNSVTVLAAKIELGPNQTLAHQDEDGNWVLNDPPPNKALELAKCQRYQVEFTKGTRYANVCILIADTNTTAYGFLCLPEPMSKKPTLFVNDFAFFQLDPKSGAEITNILVDSYKVGTNVVELKITGTGFTAGKVYRLQAVSTTDAQFLLDAN